jgi:hypothetical protein
VVSWDMVTNSRNNFMVFSYPWVQFFSREDSGLPEISIVVQLYFKDVLAKIPETRLELF